MQARSRSHAARLDAVMDAIASPRRRQILRLVWDAERSAGEIAAASDVSWPAVSQNLRVLKGSGLITERREGTHRFYRADHKALGPLESVLRQMWLAEFGRLKELAEAEARTRRRRNA
jgi:DNA-binding transcriptional ArsR family regulator